MAIVSSRRSPLRARGERNGLRALAALVLLLAGPALARGAEREFYSGYAGSLPTDPHLLARTYFDDPLVRSLIFEMEEGKGFHYSFWASEDVPSHDTHGFYWGSSTLPEGRYNYARDPADYAFSSFGDPFSDPRMSLPDLLLISAGDMDPRVRAAAERLGLVHDTSFGGDFKDVLGFESGRDFAAVLFALREGPKRPRQLAPLIRDPARIIAILGLLEEIQYVSHDEAGTFQLLAPVLDRADGPLLDRVLALNREILARWLTGVSPEMRRDLGTLTAMRHRVPYESLFTQIWHELFGLTTRELVRSGFLFDPAGPEARYKGSYPTLWRHALYDLDMK